MPGYMKYPYMECQECDFFDWNEAEDVVNKLSETCSNTNADCPVRQEGGLNG